MISIGCDIVEHNIAKELNWLTDAEFQRRIFSEAEMTLYKSNQTIKYIAGRFAVKEAVLKCLGTGMEDGISMANIEIFQTIEGKPIIKLVGEAKSLSERLGVNIWHVSITHSTNASFAVVVAE